MRQKKEAVLCFASNDDGLPKVVRNYRARYRTISQVLDKNPEILDAVHQDIKHLSQGGRKGRKGDFTSENILRALIVQDREGLPFREAVIRIGGDGFLQDFLRMRKRVVMDFTFLDKCFLAIQPETWRRVERTAGPLWRGAGSGEPEGDPGGHDGGGVEHPLPDRLVAAVGHVAGGDAAVGAGARRFCEKACRTVSTVARSKGCTCSLRGTCRASRSLASSR